MKVEVDESVNATVLDISSLFERACCCRPGILNIPIRATLSVGNNPGKETRRIPGRSRSLTSRSRRTHYCMASQIS